MAVFVQIGEHWINPLNVIYIQPAVDEVEIKETATGGKPNIRKEHVPAVMIVMLGDKEDNKLLIKGVDAAAVARELSLGINALPESGRD